MGRSVPFSLLLAVSCFSRELLLKSPLSGTRPSSWSCLLVGSWISAMLCRRRTLFLLESVYEALRG